MAIFDVQQNIRSVMTVFDLSVLNYFESTETSFSSSAFVYDNTKGFVVRLDGNDLVYTEANGALTSVTGGVLTGMTFSSGGLTQFSITGWNVDARPFFSAFFDLDWKETLDLVLMGDDQIFGSDQADILRGGTGADDLIGLTGNDKIDGEAGNDVLGGGFGNDTLKGSGGIDSFVFASALDRDFNVDTIVDFNAKREKLVLEDAVFTKIGPLGDLDPGCFVVRAAQDAGDRIIYHRATGEVFYDADGKGGEVAVLFATLEEGFRLNAGDFSII